MHYLLHHDFNTSSFVLISYVLGVFMFSPLARSNMKRSLF